jgi:hypothetical protein
VTEERWYWCMAHNEPEREDSHCPPGQRWGPYATREEALHWREKAERRNDEWDEEDRRWEEGPASTSG